MPYAEQMHCVKRNRARRTEQALLLICHAKHRAGGSVVPHSRAAPELGHRMCSPTPAWLWASALSLPLHFNSPSTGSFVPMAGFIKAKCFESIFSISKSKTSFESHRIHTGGPEAVHCCCLSLTEQSNNSKLSSKS